PGRRGGPLLAAAAEATRRLVAESARRKGSQKRGGDRGRADFEVSELAAPELREDLLALDEGLDRLAATDPEAARLVQLRYFAGLTLAEAAGGLGVSPRTADRLWSYARAWLLQALEARGEQPRGPALGGGAVGAWPREARPHRDPSCGVFRDERTGDLLRGAGPARSRRTGGLPRPGLRRGRGPASADRSVAALPRQRGRLPRQAG